MTRSEILIAGHGGQGVVELGNYIACEAIGRGFHVASTPTYGPETRGGRVKAYVVISQEEIDSPIVQNPDTLIIMNAPSMDFEPELKPEGLMILNSSIIEKQPMRKDIKVVKIPATDMADKLRYKVEEELLQGITDTCFTANSIIFGAYLALKGIDIDSHRLNYILQDLFFGKKSQLIPLNMAAIREGYFHLTERLD